MITFVIIYAVIVLFCLFLLIFPFFALWRADVNEIMKYSTISAYCASPTSKQHRILLVLTALIGTSLACLHVEEYNSRDDEDFRFWFELVASLLLPLIGVFYTTGDTHNPEGYVDVDIDNKKYPVNKKFYLGSIEWEIWKSKLIHYIAAFSYIFVFGGCNLWYSVDIIEQLKGIILFVFNIVILLAMAIFFILFISIEFFGIRKSFINKSCFFFEAVTFSGVTILATLSTIKRNNNV